MDIFLYAVSLLVHTFHCQPILPKHTSTRILLIADPQMEGDARIQREGVLGKFNVHLNDVMLRHILRSTHKITQPHATLFLGDIHSFERQRDKEFWHRVDRFRKTLPSSTASPPQLVLNISGNHDIGYGAFTSRYITQRWNEAFGESNWAVELGDHLLVGVDAMVLDGSRDRRQQRAAWEHLSKVSQVKGDKPVIIATHVPLYKDADTTARLGCEAGRTHMAKDGVPQYQTYLSEETTDALLSKLEPRWVFAGHNHDGCVHSYATPSSKVTEERTVRSVMGDYGGNVGIFEYGPDPHRDGKYVYHYQDCAFVSTSQLVTMLVVTVLVFIILCVCIVRYTKRRTAHSIPSLLNKAKSKKKL